MRVCVCVAGSLPSKEPEAVLDPRTLSPRQTFNPLNHPGIPSILPSVAQDGIL